MTTIALDFDGTCVEHKYPKIGPNVPNCISTLKKLIENNYKLILYTMRDGKELDDAVEWFDVYDIELHGIQKHPTQTFWTKSPKCHADLCIDDRNVGTPLINGCVDWDKIKEILL